VGGQVITGHEQIKTNTEPAKKKNTTGNMKRGGELFTVKKGTPGSTISDWGRVAGVNHNRRKGSVFTGHGQGEGEKYHDNQMGVAGTKCPW